MIKAVTWLITVLASLGLGGAAWAGPVEAGGPFTQAVCLSNLRLREKPDPAAPQIGRMFRGQVVWVLAGNSRPEDPPGGPGQWLPVRIPGGPAGWASADYLSLGQPAAPLVPGRAWPTLTLLSRENFSSLADLSTVGLAGHNKPNGVQYRLRSHRVPGSQAWVGPVVPPWLPRRVEPDLELQILDPVPEGYLAFYRSGHSYGGDDRYLARLYGSDGQLGWEVDLDRFLPDGQEREVQDIRYSPPLLLFNAACTSYCEQVKCRCSELVAIDPALKQKVWQTPHLISNNIFIAADGWIFCGYGFTAEPDFLYLVERNSGLVGPAQPLDSAPEYLELQDGILAVVTSRSIYRFKVGLAARTPGP